MNRRQFVYASAAGVVTFARGPELLAADYDLIVKGGRVIDPSLRVDAIRDVAITGGRVVAIEDRGGRTIVTIESEGKAALESAAGDPAYSGELERTAQWTFDATQGRLLSMSIEQETDGTGTLPQGELPIHQVTRFELTPAA